MKTKISVVGSIAHDTLETVKGNRENLLGGSAIYFTMAASKFTPVEVIGIVGDDFIEQGWDILQSSNIDSNNVTTQSGNTFRWGGRYSHDYSTRDTLFTELGVFENYVPEIQSSSNDNGILFLANIQPSLQLSVLNKMKNQISLVVADTMNLWIDIDLNGLMEVINKTDIFLLNDEEARQLTGYQNLLSAGESLLNEGPDTIIIKKGSKGSMLLEKNTTIEIPCVPDIEVFDPTGAGDSFAGGLLGYISKFGPLEKVSALLYASAIASYTVSDFGINKLINLNFDELAERVKLLENLLEK